MKDFGQNDRIRRNLQNEFKSYFVHSVSFCSFCRKFLNL